jgi:hypothetical protein
MLLLRNPITLSYHQNPYSVKRLLTKIFKICYFGVTIRNNPILGTFLVVGVRRQFKRHFARFLDTRQ